MTLFELAAIVVVLALLLALYRAVAGPTIFDRALSTNLIGTKAVVLLALLGYLSGRPHFLDIALAYALINFIATIALLRYLERGRLS